MLLLLLCSLGMRLAWYKLSCPVWSLYQSARSAGCSSGMFQASRGTLRLWAVRWAILFADSWRHWCYTNATGALKKACLQSASHLVCIICS